MEVVELYASEDEGWLGQRRAQDSAAQSEDWAPTYGELDAAGASALFRVLALRANDTFCDLGSGVGKLVVQAFLETDVGRVVGVELSDVRAEVATRVLRRLGAEEAVEAVHGNLFAFPTGRCSRVFICTAAMKQPMRAKLAEKLLAELGDARVVTM